MQRRQSLPATHDKRRAPAKRMFKEHRFDELLIIEEQASLMIGADAAARLTTIAPSQ